MLGGMAARAVRVAGTPVARAPRTPLVARAARAPRAAMRVGMTGVKKNRAAFKYANKQW